MTELFHAVTERPMEVGQKIIFDENHHNGVYARVTAYQAYAKGQDCGELYDLIHSNPENWKQVALRELALEKVRRESFPQYPSRMACLYTSRSLESAVHWAEYFERVGRKCYGVVRIRVDGRVFDGNACNCFDGGDCEEENLRLARLYWQNAPSDEGLVIETIADGILTVEEIVYPGKV